MAYPNEVTIICVGALTNIQLALQSNPEFKDNVRDFLLMGGTH